MEKAVTENVREQVFTGERALFKRNDLDIQNSVFMDGESPLKECKNISVSTSSFQWKYPIWYCDGVKVKNCTFMDTARAGIWYTNNISIEDTTYNAEKGLRRCNDLTLENVDFSDALETLWSCSNVKMKNVTVNGEYFGMNCSNVSVDRISISGGYAFDGAKNLEIRNGRFITKDIFWNCDNVTVYDSYITSEYVGWNSKNVKFVNCCIESLQGMCYMDNLTMVNCCTPNTTLAFEYSTVDIDIPGKIESIKNPISGKIKCSSIENIIFDDPAIDPSKTLIVQTHKDGCNTN